MKELIWKRRVGLRELKERLAEPEPDRRVDRDPGRCEKPDVGIPQECPVAREVHRRRALGGRRFAFLAIPILDTETVDQERRAIHQRVQEERDRAERRKEERCQGKSDPESRKRRALEPGRRLAPKDLARRGRKGNVAKD